MRLLLVLVSLCTSLSSFGQTDGFVSIELGGVGGFGSIGYEKEFKRYEKFGLDYRFALSAAPIDRNNGTALVFPLLIHGIYGTGTHRADIGAGQTITITTKGSAFVRMPLSFGYRIEPVDQRYFFRFAYTPIVSYIYNFQWEHWGGITFGFKLKEK